MVPILMYHQVSDRVPPSYARYTVTPRAFDGHLRLLRTLGYRSIPLSAVAARPASGIPRRAVAITFDDGFEDAVRCAGPLLAKHGMTATFFVVPSLLGRTSEWTRATRGCEMPLASAGAIRELVAAGFTCGSHTMTHPRLTELDEATCRAELRDAKDRLEDLLGVAVSEVAYPFGAVDATIVRIAAECGYQAGCTTEKRLALAGDDPLLLPRVHVRGSDSLADLMCGVCVGRAVREQAQVVMARAAAWFTVLSGAIPPE